MTANFDEQQVRMHFRFLGHAGLSGVTVLEALSPDREFLAAGFFDDEDAFVETCKELNGKANLYVGCNPRMRELLDLAPNMLIPGCRTGGKDDIMAMTTLFLDLDVKRDKKRPSTDVQVRKALVSCQT